MRNLPKLVAAFLVIACVTLVPQYVFGASIIIRTGVDGSLTPLGENVADPFWDISVQAGAFTDAEVVNSEVICCGMETAGLQARWISDPSVTDGSVATGWGVGPLAIAQRSFDLTGFNLATTAMNGFWRVADLRQGVYLNNTLINPATADGQAGWDADQAIFSAGLFVPGMNVLELRGTSVNSGWDGFWLDVTIQDGITSVPEPGTFALLGIGFAGINAARSRRRTA